MRRILRVLGSLSCILIIILGIINTCLFRLLILGSYIQRRPNYIIFFSILRRKLNYLWSSLFKGNTLLINNNLWINIISIIVKFIIMTYVMTHSNRFSMICVDRILIRLITMWCFWWTVAAIFVGWFNLMLIAHYFRIIVSIFKEMFSLVLFRMISNVFWRAVSIHLGHFISICFIWMIVAVILWTITDILRWAEINGLDMISLSLSLYFVCVSV